MRRLLTSLLLALTAACGSEAEPQICVQLDERRTRCGDEVVLTSISGTDAPIVQARLNGKPIRLLVDTGAEMTVISSSWLEVPDQVLTRAKSLCFGELCLRGEPIYAWETPFSSAEPEGINGFVGMSTLELFTLSFDGDSIELAAGSAPCPGSPVPLTFTDYGSPRVDVTVAELSFPGTVIDTGALFTLLSDGTVQALPPSTLTNSEPSEVCTVNGCTPGAFVSNLSRYCVAHRCIDQLPVKHPVFDAVGMSFLAQTPVSFDFPGATLSFCE